MTNRVTKVWLFWLLAAAAHAAVDGTVVNGTTGKPQPGAAVTLLSMGGGNMAVKGTASSDAAGRFRIDQTVDGPHLLQAVHQGVTYNLLLRPETPSSQVTLEVYDASGALGLAKVLRHAVLLEPTGMDLAVRENILLRNDGKVTFNRPWEGTFRFYVPASAAGSLRVISRSASGTPLEQAPVKTGEPGVHQLDLPIKPGDTQLDLSYTLLFRIPGEFTGKTLQTDVPVRLVVPTGVTLTGDGLKFLGQDSKGQASNYVAETPEYRVMIRTGAAPVAGNRMSEEADSVPSQILPAIYANLYPILALAFAVLALGFIRLYRMNAPPAGLPAPVVNARKSTVRREERKRPQLAARRA